MYYVSRKTADARTDRQTHTYSSFLILLTWLGSTLSSCRSSSSSSSSNCLFSPNLVEVVVVCYVYILSSLAFFPATRTLSLYYRPWKKGRWTEGCTERKNEGKKGKKEGKKGKKEGKKGKKEGKKDRNNERQKGRGTACSKDRQKREERKFGRLLLLLSYWWNNPGRETIFCNWQKAKSKKK